MPKRNIPNLYIVVQEGIDFDLIQSNKQIQNTIYNSVVIGIEEAAKYNKTEATIVELNSSGNYISLNYIDWEKSLKKAQTYFLQLEEYEKCASIQKLIESLDSYGSKRLHRKITRTNKSNNRSSKYLKTKEKNN